MRLILLLFTTMLTAGPALAGQVPASSKPDAALPGADGSREQPPDSPETGLPVSLDKIREALQQPPAQTLRGLNDIPNFTVEIHERSKVSLDDLIKSLDEERAVAASIRAAGTVGAVGRTSRDEHIRRRDRTIGGHGAAIPAIRRCC